MTNKRTTVSIAVFLSVVLIASFAASAQQEKLQLDHLNRLSVVASEAVEVNMDQPAVQALNKLMTLNERERARLSGMTSRLRGIYVRGYEFEREGEYSQDDIEIIRNQLRSPGWTRVVQVGGRNGSRDEVYLKQGNQEIDAFAVVSTSARNICVINLVGQLNLDDIGLLDRELNISNCGKWNGRRRSK